MPLHGAIVCDLQYLYAILALYMLEISFLCIIILCPCKIVMSEHAFTLGELTTFNYIRPMYTIPSLEYERKRVLFIPPSVGNFSLERKSFCIL